MDATDGNANGRWRRSWLVAVMGVAMAVAALAFARTGNRQAAQIEALIAQLGHEEYAQREAASKQLTEIGPAATAALQRVAKDSSDPEIRWRAREVLAELEAIAVNRELERWEGFWIASERQYLVIKKGEWESGTPTFGPIGGRLRGVSRRENVLLVDMIVDFGPTAGRTCQAIYRFDGKTLEYCGSYEVRPTEFKNEGHMVFIPFVRTKDDPSRKVMVDPRLPVPAPVQSPPASFAPPA